MQSGNTYRMKADGSQVEYVTHGQVNPFGLAFDPMGNLYSCDCHSRPIYCLLPGAFYPSFGKPDDGLGFGPEMIQHDHGSTGIAGISYYVADHFPAPYRDTIFIGNVVTSRINRDALLWTGASPKAIAQPDFLSSDDPWFRPVDIELGPDGALYVADFYNRIIGHYEVPLTHPGRDRERGRIWRIVYRGADGKAPSPTSPRKDWTTATLPDLVADLGHPNLAVRVKATNQIVDRGGDASVAAARSAVTDPSPLRRAHALWALQRLGVLDPTTLANFIVGDKDASVRVHALRIVGERSSVEAAHSGLTRDGLRDPSPFARRAAAESLARHPSPDNVRPLLAAVGSVDPADTHLSHALRISLRDQLAALGAWERSAPFLDDASRRLVAEVAPGVPNAQAAEFLASYLKKVKESPEQTARYLRHIARYGAEPEQSALGGLVRGVAEPSSRVALIEAILEGEQARGAGLSNEVAEIAAATGRVLLGSKRDEEIARGIELAGSLKLGEFREPLGAVVADRSKAEGRRDAALAALVAIDPVGTIPALARIIVDASAPAPLRSRAAGSLAAMNRPEASESLVNALPTAPGGLQAAIATGLAQSSKGIGQLLDAIQAGKASARLLQERAVGVRLEATKLPGVKERVAMLLKGLPPAEQAIQTTIQKRREAFDPSRVDLARGASLFEKNCAACHQLGGKGARIGPQLDGVGLRGAERLLEDVLDPNRNVDQAFRTTGLSLKDGRAVSGLLLREEGQILVLADSQGKDVRIPKADVEERSTSQLSPMPANWSEQIPEAEFSHLLAYLLAQKPRDEPARP